MASRLRKLPATAAETLMPSERVQRQIDRFLDEAEEAAAVSDWARTKDRAQNALALDPDSQDARTYLAAAQRALGMDSTAPAASFDSSPITALVSEPTSFC